MLKYMEEHPEVGACQPKMTVVPVSPTPSNMQVPQAAT